MVNLWSPYGKRSVKFILNLQVNISSDESVIKGNKVCREIPGFIIRLGETLSFPVLKLKLLFPKQHGFSNIILAAKFTENVIIHLIGKIHRYCSFAFFREYLRKNGQLQRKV